MLRPPEFGSTASVQRKRDGREFSKVRTRQKNDEKRSCNICQRSCCRDLSSNLKRYGMSRTTPDHPRRSIEFAVLSFEGPDPYSLVGGLGVRVTEMTRVMAGLGYKTRLFFVGDPDEPDFESSEDGLLCYHRWSRWVSKQYPSGVYHGELAKVEDYQKSLPEFLVDNVIAPNAKKQVTTVVLGEDWHTASTMIRISELLKERRLDSRAVLFWNANNVFGFEAIDFKRLAEATQLLTVSRDKELILHHSVLFLASFSNQKRSFLL